MNLKLLQFITSVLALICLPFIVSAQCQWRLDLSDSFGDGWNGGQITINSGNLSQTYTLDNFNDNGSDSTVYFLVYNNEPVTISWTEGFYDTEVSFQIFNAAGISVLDITFPTAGELFAGTGTCPPCVEPINVYIENIYDKRVKIRWTPGIGSQNPVGWWVIYGPTGFVPAAGIGDTAYVTTPKATLTGLTPKTGYSFYVMQDCGNGSNGEKVGPYSLVTYWSNDIAVTGIISPESACDLGTETIFFEMSNPGSNPQSLIPYNFYVNGNAGGVPQPEDGYYTGVIGKDSTEIIQFETTYDFSAPGEYELMVFTQLEGDEDIANDTLRYYFNNVLVAPYAQGFEKWNGGWTVNSDPNSFGTPSWEYGVPAGTDINAAGEGQRAWVTNLDGFFNYGERSYIQSTCFDFSTLTTKPAMEFLTNYSCLEGSDGLFVESSIDDGASWQRIGTGTTGMNWYQGPDPNTGLIEVWSGNSQGWIPTHHLINGVAGQSNVLFRFGFSGFSFNSFEGAGIDDFKILVPPAKDLASVDITTLGATVDCGLQNDKITFKVVNVGGSALSPGYKLFYSINNGAPVSFTPANNILLPDENLAYTFSGTFDSRDVVTFIKCWAVADGDLNLLNDTVVYTISHLPREIPFHENFEASDAIPGNWTTSPGVFVTNDHNNISNVLAHNLYEFNPSYSITTPRFGTIGASDSLRFDYRLTNYLDGTVATALSNGTKVEVKISDDCGQTFQTIYTISSLNHTPTVNLRTRKISLSAYAGKNIVIQFVSSWGAGDFWVDLDNIGIIACPADMKLTADVSATAPGQSNGAATAQVGLGNPPYKYYWSTGATTQSVTGLGEGNYTVIVVDASGCSDTLSVSVITSSTGDLSGMSSFSVRPNPTSGLLMLDMAFDRSVQLNAVLTNLLGQPVWISNPTETNTFSEVIDLGAQPAGVYLLRITANGEVVTRKVIKN
jgi:hypothetical protein